MVGSLPWQTRNNSIDFGETPDPNTLLSIADSIKTFTEGTDPDSSDIAQIRKNIKETNRIVFMGFAFHKLNKNHPYL